MYLSPLGPVHAYKQWYAWQFLRAKQMSLSRGLGIREFYEIVNKMPW